jgi:ADP-ribosyl-[dinitrogen reductase] hydrolase
MTTLSRFRGCLLGLACGDAVGTTVEFCPRGSFPLVTDMIGGGPFDLPVGAWTDDTSMALCLATSLIERGCFDAKDQMERYLRWLQQGYFSSTGRCFDIGITTRLALSHFQETGEPFAGSMDSFSAGNGSIMRLGPVPLFYYPDEEAAFRWAGESSRTTHGTQECIDSCQLLASMIHGALTGRTKDEVLFGNDPSCYQSPKVQAIAAGAYRSKTIDLIKGTGYVIDCLEASAWCYWQTSNWKDAILQAVNLGDDADTTGAVSGQLAGAFYGEEAIPAEWLSRLVMAKEIGKLAERLSGPKHVFGAVRR